MMALFSSIVVAAPNVTMHTRLSGESAWTDYTLTAGTYATLPDLLHHLNDLTGVDGFSWTLFVTADLAGFAVRLVHATPFELAFDAVDGCHAVLGFGAQAYAAAEGVLQSVLAPQLAVELGDSGQNDPSLTTRNGGGQMSLSGDVCFTSVSERTTSRLRMRGVSPTRWAMVLDLHEAAASGRSLYLATDAFALSATPAWAAMRAMRPNWKKQTALVGKRSWPAPHPLFIDADYELEAI